MSKTKKARATGGTVKRADAGASFSPEYSTRRSNRQGKIVENLLPKGEKNAIKTRELVTICGFRSARELRAQIERERAAGALILSTVRSGGGYFRPSAGEEGRREIAAFIRTVSRRATSSQRILKYARRALRDCAGQTRIAEEGKRECGKA